MNRSHLDIVDSTFSWYKENLGKRGKSSGMSNHTLSECPSTPLKPKPLEAIMSLLVTYHVSILYYHIRNSQNSYENTTNHKLDFKHSNIILGNISQDIDSRTQVMTYAFNRHVRTSLHDSLTCHISYLKSHSTHSKIFS